MHIYDELVGFQSFLFTNFVYIFRTCSSLGKEKTGFFLHLCSLNDKSPHSTLKTIVSTYWLKENCPRGKLPPNPKTNPNTNSNPNQGTFFLGPTVWLPPNPKTNHNVDPKPNPKQGEIFLGGQFSRYLSRYLYVDIFHVSTKHVLFPQQLFYEHNFTKAT